MTILTLNKKQLESQIGKIDDKLRNKIDMFGTPIDGETDDEISVEVFPNRPDLLSLQGFSRAINAFLGKKGNLGLKEFKVYDFEKDFKVIIDKSVKDVRPFTACAIVKGLKFDDEKIMEIIDVQEKLHGSYGRNRKKLAIGIYPLEEIKLPIKFSAKKPEDIKFQPLEFPREINGRQILSQHPTGREYGDLLKDCEVFPVFEDASGEVLSMPPIINSEKTGKISEKTKDIFIECSGFQKEYLQKTLNMVVCVLSELGGKIYSMEIEDSVDGNWISPDLEPEKMEFSIEGLNKWLGLELKDKEIEDLLGKMGIGFEKDGEKAYALIPPYRTDILHEVDLSEEVAISYGYDNFKPDIPEISTIGEENGISILKRKISDVLVGLGLLEVSSYHLSTKEKQFKRIGIKEFKDKMIEVIDSKTENNILRTSLFANHIAILAENSDASYPQKVFELGKVFSHDSSSETGVGEEERLCVSLCSEKANFTEVKQILDYLMRMLDVKYSIEETEREGFIDGRCGSVIVDGSSVGVIGEVSPFVLKNNKIRMPMGVLEIGLDKV
jgi:phenylalanyl-tRNA synthetase beta chain